MPVSIQPEFLGPESVSPGTCVSCHAARRKHESGVLDLGVRIDLERGWLQVCQACTEEAAHGFGMLSPSQSALLRDELALERARREEAEAALAEAERALDALVSFRARRQAKAAE